VVEGHEPKSRAAYKVQVEKLRPKKKRKKLRRRWPHTRGGKEIALRHAGNTARWRRTTKKRRADRRNAAARGGGRSPQTEPGTQSAERRGVFSRLNRAEAPPKRKGEGKKERKKRISRKTALEKKLKKSRNETGPSPKKSPKPVLPPKGSG